MLLSGQMSARSIGMKLIVIDVSCRARALLMSAAMSEILSIDVTLISASVLVLSVEHHRGIRAEDV